MNIIKFYRFVPPNGVQELSTMAIDYFDTETTARSIAEEREAAAIKFENDFYNSNEGKELLADASVEMADYFQNQERELNTIPLNVPGIDENGYDVNGVHVSSILRAVSPEGDPFARQGKTLSELLRDRDAIEVEATEISDKNMTLEFLITFGTGKHQIIANADGPMIQQVPWKIPIGIYLNDPVYEKIVTGHVKTSQGNSSIVKISVQLCRKELSDFTGIISEFSVKRYYGKNDTADIDRFDIFYVPKYCEQMEFHLDINILNDLLWRNSDTKISN